MHTISQARILAVIFQSLSPVWVFATHGLPHGSPSLSFTKLWESMSVESIMASNHLVLCHLLLFLLSIFPRIRGFSNELALHFSFSNSPSNEYSGLISFRIDKFDLFAVKALSRVFSNTTVEKHQFFGTQTSLWSNSHMHM